MQQSQEQLPLLDTCFNACLALVKRIYPASPNPIVGLMFTQCGENQWTCEVKCQKDGTTILPLGEPKGNGATAQAAFNNLTLNLAGRVRQRKEEDEKALAQSDRAASILSQSPLPRA